MIEPRTMISLVISAFLAMQFSSVNSAVVPVVNPSFEINPLSAGLPEGWEIYNPGSISVETGTFTPTTLNDFYNPPGPGGVPVPPDGDYVGWVFVDRFDSGPVGFQQTLTSTLMANSVYDLSVAIGNLQTATSPRTGNFLNFDDFPGYSIQLLAGGSVLAEDLNSVSIAEGDFGIASLSYAVGASHALLGEALGIRLINQNNLDLITWQTSNSEVDFDDVQLSVSAIPVPAAAWLFGTALIGLVGISRRRKAA